MKIENRTGHSVNISDIERNFAPKEEVSFYEISKQELLKSMSLRNLIRSSRFYPIEIDNESSLEVNLKKRKRHCLIYVIIRKRAKKFWSYFKRSIFGL